MITYEFLLERKLAVIKLSGSIEKDTLISFLKHLFQRKETAEVSGALLDYRTAELNFSIKEVNDIVKLRLDNSNVLQNVKTVHLVNTSFETAFAVLYSQKIPSKMADIGICSTLGRAIELLNIPFNEDGLEDRLNNLAFSY